MCHEHPWDRFKFKPGSWPIHRSHFFYFHAMGSFPTYILVVCLFWTIIQMCFLLTLDLRKKLSVTIQHLVGSNMEPLLLGCGDSTKVHPKVTKPLSNFKIAYAYATCNILAQWSFCRCFSILWYADFVLTSVRIPWIFAFWRVLSMWRLLSGTAGTISTILTINNLGFAWMMACFSLEVSRTESNRLEEANILPNSAVAAIIAAVPWLQMILCHARKRRLLH